MVATGTVEVSTSGTKNSLAGGEAVNVAFTLIGSIEAPAVSVEVSGRYNLHVTSVLYGRSAASGSPISTLTLEEV